MAYEIPEHLKTPDYIENTSKWDEDDYDVTSVKAPTCPHCFRQETDHWEIFASDPWSEENHEVDCGWCEKTYFVKQCITIDYESRKKVEEGT